jgi:phage terminase large subunit
MKINNCYKSDLLYTGRYLVLLGGAGSGKSYFATQKLILRAMQSQHRFLVLRKVERTIRESVFKLFTSVIIEEGLSEIVSINKTDKTIRFKNGSEIIFAGLDDPEKIKSIAGITGMFLEEATEFGEADFDQLDLRLRGLGSDYKQIIVAFNPIDHRHWLKRRFFDTLLPNAKNNKTTYLDNAFIDDEYKVKMGQLKDQDENLYNIYALGNWGVPLKGLIYKEWKPYARKPQGEIVYGLDFGYNAPSALVKVTFDDEQLYVEELLYESGLTTYQLIERLKEFELRDDAIYCDSAAPDKIEELYNSGFNTQPADKNVTEGIEKVKSMPLYIHEKSENLKKELSTYKWAQDKSGILLDKPLKYNDHLLDAMRYAVYTHSKHFQGVGIW